MEQSLMMAAEEGDTNRLRELLQEDHLLFQKVMALPNADAHNPLSVAVLAGQAHFVKELLEKMPALARERDKRGRTPLHLASAIGNTDIVRDILMVSPNLGLMKDKDGLTPLHYAAIKGRVQVIVELLSACPESAKEVTAKDETALHLAVTYSQVAALKVLIERVSHDQDVMNAVDCHGDTFVQLAQRMKQLEVQKLLRNQGMLRNEVLQTEYEGVTVVPIEPDVANPGTSQIKTNGNIDKDKIKSDAEKIFSIGSSEDIFQVVTSIFAQLTFNAVLQPPPTIWKEGKMDLDFHCLFNRWRRFFQHYSMADVLKSPITECAYSLYYSYMAFNTAGFLLCLYLLLINPKWHQFPVLLTLFFGVIIMMFFSYVTVLVSRSPALENFIIICVYATILILSGLLLYYSIVAFIWLSKKMIYRNQRQSTKAE